MNDDDLRRVLAAMRSGEWLRTQWIARVAFALGTAKWHPDHGLASCERFVSCTATA